MIALSDRKRLGSEHPLCDSLQFAFLVLYFTILVIDGLGIFIFGISSIIVGFFSFPLLIVPALITWSLGVYLSFKSHEAVFGKPTEEVKLNDSGVYSWTRHPMYLGILMFCLGFFLVLPSAFSLIVWFAFFVFYDKMATYEEKDLIRILGKEYISYCRRVPKWGLRLRKVRK